MGRITNEESPKRSKDKRDSVPQELIELLTLLCITCYNLQSTYIKYLGKASSHRDGDTTAEKSSVTCPRPSMH